MDHHATGAIIHPVGLGVAGDHQAARADVAPAVQLVLARRREGGGSWLPRTATLHRELRTSDDYPTHVTVSRRGMRQPLSAPVGGIYLKRLVAHFWVHYSLPPGSNPRIRRGSSLPSLPGGCGALVANGIGTFAYQRGGITAKKLTILSTMRRVNTHRGY